MKKTTLGCFLFLAGMLSTALLLSGSMSSDLTINGQISFWKTLSAYGLIPAFYLFMIIAAVGLVMAIIGLIDKK